VFNRIFAALAGAAGTPETAMIDATHLKAHRTASSLLKKELFPRCIGRTKGGLNSKLHAVCDDQGRPLILALTEGQTSDYKGAALVFDHLPNTRALIGDKGYDADWLRAALVARGIAPCIPPKTNRIEPIPCDRTLYKARPKIEIMFGRLKDWRRVHTRYDRCAHTFMAAIVVAAIVTFWL
jgi:transposase